MLTCSVCGTRGLAKMFATIPCNHYGCAVCLMRGERCFMCGHQCALVPHPLIKAFRGAQPAAPLDIVPCASCAADASDHCKTCDALYCDEHAAPHAEHETVEVYLYEPTAPVPLCEKHGKPFECFVPPDAMLCADCPDEVRTPLSDYESALRCFIDKLSGCCGKLIGRINECLDGARALSHKHKTTLEMVVALKKERHPEGAARYETQLSVFNEAYKLTEATLKQLECELMGIECRLDSLTAVCALEGVHFLAVAAGYADSLMRAMACKFTDVLLSSRKAGDAHSASRLTVDMGKSSVVRWAEPLWAFGVEGKARKARFLGHNLVILMEDTLEIIDIRTDYMSKVCSPTRVIDFSVHGDSLAVLVSHGFSISVPSTDSIGEVTFVEKMSTAILLHERYVYLAQGRTVARFNLDKQTIDRRVALPSYAKALSERNDQLFVTLTKGAGCSLTFNLDPQSTASHANMREYASNRFGSIVYVLNDAAYFGEYSGGCGVMFDNEPTVSVDISKEYPLALVASATEVHVHCF